MSAGTDIIKSALENIGAHSLASPATPATIENGKDVLNSMLQLWLSWGIEIAFTPLDASGDELSEPADARNAIVQNLALELSGQFDNGANIISAQLKDNARRSFANIKRLYQKISIPDKVVSSTLPMGAGNSRGRTRRVFAGKGQTVNG